MGQRADSPRARARSRQIRPWPSPRTSKRTVASGQTLAVLEEGDTPRYGVAMSADGARIATVEADGKTRVFDGASGKAVLTIEGHAGAVYGVAFAPDGSWLATAGADGTVRRWDAVTGQALWTREGHPGRVYGLAFSPDGSRLATAGRDGTVRVWEIATGKRLTTFAILVTLPIPIPPPRIIVCGSGRCPDGR